MNFFSKLKRKINPRACLVVSGLKFIFHWNLKSVFESIQYRVWFLITKVSSANKLGFDNRLIDKAPRIEFWGTPTFTLAHVVNTGHSGHPFVLYCLQNLPKISKDYLLCHFTLIYKEDLNEGFRYIKKYWSYFIAIIRWLVDFMCVRVCVCLFPSTVKASTDWTEQWMYCQIYRPAMLRWGNVKNLRLHVIVNHSRDLLASNCARVSIKPDRATRSKRQFLKLSKNQR